MTRTKRVFMLTGTALLVVAVLSGCYLLPEPGGQEEWYILLKIGDPAAKTIVVEEYEVTEVQVALFAPGEDLPFYEITWYAQDPPLSQLIPVSEVGQYRVDVLHIADNDGEPVEVAEFACFDIQAMIITIVDIVPGAIGTINVEPGGTEPEEPWEFLLGFWIPEPYSKPDTACLEIRENGTWTMWPRYDGTGSPDDSGTWYWDDDLLYISSDGTFIGTEVVRVSDDEIIFVEMGDNSFYIRGTEPGGWVFDQDPNILFLSTGDWTEGSITSGQIILYSFEAAVAGTYDIYWKGHDDPDLPAFTAEIRISAYQEDQDTPFFEGLEHSGYVTPESVVLNAGETVYIVAEGTDQEGSYGLRVMQQ